MITSPIAGFLLGIVVMLLLWAIIAGMSRLGGPIGRLARPRWVNAFFGKAQIASAAYMGYAHGHNDAQKTMGIIAMTLIGAQSAGGLDDLPSWLSFLHPGTGLAAGAGIPMWIVLTCAVVMAAGTARAAGRSSRRSATRWSSCIPSTVLPQKPARQRC